MLMKGGIPLVISLLGLLCGPCIASPTNDLSLNPLQRSNDIVREDQEWCDEVLGCLYITDDWYTSTRPINVLPDSREDINCRFYLHTREEPNADTDYAISAEDLTSLEESPFDASKPTKLIVHGFIDTGRTKWLSELAIGLLDYGDYNVIRVDWGDGSLPMYSSAAANTRVVGLEIGLLMNTLITTYGLDPADIHCMGHSLGSHVCGYGGEQIEGMGRITGLDPAGPYFTGTPYFVHLDPSDAVFVDAIHTDADSIFMLGYGTGQPMGNIDIFPNSGHDQPGCDPVQIAIDMITEDMIDAGRDLVACSHIRAIKYFQASLDSSCEWVAHECYDYGSFELGNCYTCGDDDTQCAYLGIRGDEYVDKTREFATFYIDTDDDEPFCMQHYAVSILTAYPKEAESWVMGRLYVTLYGDTGEIIEEVQITEDHERIDHGQVKNNMFISQQNTGHILRVEVKWVYDDKVTNPGTYCWNLVCNRSLYVQSVQVSAITHAPESERLDYTMLGCSTDGSTSEIEDGNTVSFVPGSNCTPVKVQE